MILTPYLKHSLGFVKYSAALSFCALLVSCDKNQSPQSSLEVARTGVHSAALDTFGENALIASIYDGGSFWNLQSQARLFNWNHAQDELSTLIAADISDDNQWALSAAAHTLVLWQTKTGKSERFWSAPAEILDVELNQNASLALLGLDDHSAVIFDVRRGGIRRTFQHENRVRSVDFSLDHSLALTGSEDHSARLWDTKSGNELIQLRHQDDVQLVKLSDDGRLAFSASKYDRALIWSTKDGAVQGDIPLKAEHLKRGLRFTSARFSSDNRYLLTGRPDQIVQLWNLTNFTPIARWKLPKRSPWKPTGASVVDVAFSKDPKVFIAIASNGFTHQLVLNLETNPSESTSLNP